MLERQKEFAKNHIILTSIHHVAAGFGLAVLAQFYSAGNSFIPMSMGWIFVGFSLAVHMYEFVAPNLNAISNKT